MKDMFALADAKRGQGSLTEAQQERFKKILNTKGIGKGKAEAGEIGTGRELAERGSSMTNGYLKGDADLQNQKDVIGQKLIPSVHAFEKSALNMSQTVANTLAPAIGEIAHSAEKLSTALLALFGGGAAPATGHGH